MESNIKELKGDADNISNDEMKIVGETIFRILETRKIIQDEITKLNNVYIKDPKEIVSASRLKKYWVDSLNENTKHFVEMIKNMKEILVLAAEERIVKRNINTSEESESISRSEAEEIIKNQRNKD